MTRHQRRRTAALLIVGLLAGGGGGAVLHAQPPDVQVDEFVPLDEVPPEDQLPAAPLLITAYAAVWILLLAYLWSLWRRLAAVERDLGQLARQVERQSRHE